MDGGLKGLSRSQRQRLKVTYLIQENATLEQTVKALLDVIDRAIQPRITDADRIRYRCMVQDIRQELQDPRAYTVAELHADEPDDAPQSPKLSGYQRQKLKAERAGAAALEERTKREAIERKLIEATNNIAAA